MDFIGTMQTYFRGEKFEAGLILLATAILIVTALVLWLWIRHPFCKGLAATLAVSALVAGIVGGTVYVRTEQQLTELTAMYQADHAKFRGEEGARMQQVMQAFSYYRIMYAMALVITLILVFNTATGVAHGVAVGLLVFAALGFTIDYYAEARGKLYVSDIDTIN